MRVKLFTKTLSELKTQLVSFAGDTAPFNKAKGKDEKRAVVLQQWFKKFVYQVEQGQPAKVSKEEGKNSIHAEVKAAPESKKTPKEGCQKAAPESKNTPKERCQKAKTSSMDAEVKAASESKKTPKTQNSKQKQKDKEVKDVMEDQFPPDILEGIVEETPELFAKIIIIDGVWMDAILEQGKTLELRKSHLVPCKSEVLYFAVGKVIKARCLVHYGFPVKDQAHHDELLPWHQCPEPPYGFPYMAHYLTEVQKLKDLEFQKLQGCIGRSLYGGSQTQWRKTLLKRFWREVPRKKRNRLEKRP